MQNIAKEEVMTWYNSTLLFILLILWIVTGGYIYYQVTIVRGNSDRFKPIRLAAFRLVCGPYAWLIMVLDYVIDKYCCIPFEDYRSYIKYKILNWLIGSEYY